MKNIKILLSTLVLPVVAFAQVTTEPENVEYYKNVYLSKMSPNGLWIGSNTIPAGMYNTSTGEITIYENLELSYGLGNSVANNGQGVGDYNDTPVMVIGEEIIYPDLLMEYTSCIINAITPDATRICGVIKDKDSEIDYYPFVADLDASGNVVNVVVPDYPKLDLFQSPPMYVKAQWISEDGKTMSGEVVDFRGMYVYPIVFTEVEDGVWEYSLPSESLFNPDHIEIGLNPDLTEPFFPEPEEFMSGIRKSLYLEAFQEWVANGAIGDSPNIFIYMTEEEAAEYIEKATTYNDWLENTWPAIVEYRTTYQEIINSSPNFVENDACLHPLGQFMVTHAFVLENNDIIAKWYKFNLTNGAITIYNIPEEDLYPHQILSDGTVVGTTNIRGGAKCYLLLPGRKTFTSFVDFLQPTYPEIAAWITTNFETGSGVISLSEDLSVISGATTADNLTVYDYENADFYLSSYILTDMVLSGVKGIEADKNFDGTFKVFNLQGVKVLETKDASAVENLQKGIYIVNGKKIYVK